MNWTIYNLRNTREAVNTAIQADPKLGEADRAWLLARIAAVPSECFAISVNGYLQTHKVGKDTVCNVMVTVSGLS